MKKSTISFIFAGLFVICLAFVIITDRKISILEYIFLYIIVIVDNIKSGLEYRENEKKK